MARCRPFSNRSGASTALLRSTELRKSAAFAGDRATRPKWYSGVRETVWGLGFSSRVTANATVKRRGTWWAERRVLREQWYEAMVNCASLWQATVLMRERGTLEAGICTLRDRVKVHQVLEVEGPQDRAVARILRARSPPVGGRAAELVSATSRTVVSSTRQVTSCPKPAHRLTYGLRQC